MTVTEMRDEVIRLTEYDSDEPAQATALFFLNLAAQECSRFTEYLMGFRTYNVAANTQIVRETAKHFATIEELWWNNTRLFPHESAWLLTPPIQTGTPQNYILSNTQVLLIPNPSTSGTLLVRGALLHPEMVTGTPGSDQVNECLFPSDLHHSICSYAAGLWLSAYTPHHEQTGRANNLKQIAIQKWTQLKEQVIQTGYKTMRYKQ